jgi:hypothetical protein
MSEESTDAAERSSSRTLAARLIACEARGRHAGGSEVPDAFQICEKLRAPLATLMGSTGYHALLSRALTIARQEHAWLGTVPVPAEGPLAAPAEAAAPVTPQALAAGSAALLSTLLGLLMTFIGEPLTLHLVREVWPDLPPQPPDSEPRNGATP